MTFNGAIIREQGVTFGIVVVKPHVLAAGTQRNRLVVRASRLVGGIPTIRMAQQPNGQARYFGRSDIVRFMAKVPLAAVPWKKYRIDN
ncbi:MAG: hypothetical protein H0T94_13045 [Acidimicrobiia bacterium]|nr:hypothetical protein [Acidimicrobiia bacterium]